MVTDMNRDINIPPINKALYVKVRSGFVAQDTTLSAWCKNKGINPSNAKACLMGNWDGPKAKELRQQIVEASGLSITQDNGHQGAA